MSASNLVFFVVPIDYLLWRYQFVFNSVFTVIVLLEIGNRFVIVVSVIFCAFFTEVVPASYIF